MQACLDDKLYQLVGNIHVYAGFAVDDACYEYWLRIVKHQSHITLVRALLAILQHTPVAGGR